jgi:hypothetical protein
MPSTKTYPATARNILPIHHQVRTSCLEIPLMSSTEEMLRRKTPLTWQYHENWDAPVGANNEPLFHLCGKWTCGISLQNFTNCLVIMWRYRGFVCFPYCLGRLYHGNKHKCNTSSDDIYWTVNWHKIKKKFLIVTKQQCLWIIRNTKMEVSGILHIQMTLKITAPV